MTATLEDVRTFWTQNLNGLKFLESFPQTAEQFWAASAFRYKYHYHLQPLFDRIAAGNPGAALLEIGCGMGDDTAQWAKRGMKVTAIDLTEPAVECTRKRLQACGLQAEVRTGNAERLDFPDNTFDFVYSFGVLHHSPDTPKTIEEVRRVLKPGGRALIMLYNRKSLNYAIHRILSYPFDGSKKDPCPVEHTYTKDQIREMFRNYAECDITVDYLFGTGYGIVNRMIPGPLHRLLGRYHGLAPDDRRGEIRRPMEQKIPGSTSPARITNTLRKGPIGLVIGLTILAFCIYSIGPEKILLSLRQVRPPFLLGGFFFIFCWLLLGALNIRTMLNPLAKVAYGKVLNAYSNANMVALIMPGQVGDVIIIKFFKDLNIPVTQGITLFATDKVITLLWYGLSPCTACIRPDYGRYCTSAAGPHGFIPLDSGGYRHHGWRSHVFFPAPACPPLRACPELVCPGPHLSEKSQECHSPQHPDHPVPDSGDGRRILANDPGLRAFADIHPGALLCHYRGTGCLCPRQFQRPGHCGGRPCVPVQHHWHRIGAGIVGVANHEGHSNCCGIWLHHGFKPVSTQLSNGIDQVNSKNHQEGSDALYDEEWIKSAWGESSQEFINNPLTGIRPRVKRAIDLAEISPGMHVLDIGCGRGEVVLYCANLGCRTTGIDFSQPVLDIAEQAKKNLPADKASNVRFIRGDVNTFGFPAGSFDRVFMLDLVEHLHDSQLTKIYGTVRYLLKDDGLLIIHTLPNRWIYRTYSFARIFLPWLEKDPRNEYEKKIHINEQSCISVNNLLTTCGLYNAVRIEDGFLAQAEWYRDTLFGDKRDRIYKFLRRPTVKLLFKFLSRTPLRLLFMNDIYAVAAKFASPLANIQFKQGYYETMLCAFFRK